jgi:hypothetical protein
MRFKTAVEGVVMSSYSAFIEEAMAPRHSVIKPKRKVPRSAAIVAIALLTAGAIWFAVRAGLRNHQHNLVVAQLQQHIQPREVFAAVRNGQITQEDAIGLMRESPQFKRRAQEMHDYFELPPGPARKRFLDKLIDQRMKDMVSRGNGSFPAGGPGGPGAGGLPGAGGANGAQASKDQPQRAANHRTAFLESVPPGDRAQMQQFRYDMHQQMQSRGTSGPGGR